MNTERPNYDPVVRLMTSHQNVLYAYIYSMFPYRAMAQDILQETNLTILKHCDDFLLGSNFKAWSFRIAYFQALAYWKREKRRGWLSLSNETLDRLHAESESHFTEFDSREAALKDCITKLPLNDSTILRLFYEQKRGLEQISVQVGRSVGALKQVLFRIRRTLKFCIENKTA